MRMKVENIVYDDNNFYFVPKDINILFSYSHKDEHISIIGEVPEEDPYTERLFNGLCKVDNKIVLVPYAAKKIWIYDLALKTWESVSVEANVPEIEDSKFSGCVQYLGKVYFLGYGYKGILSLDINTKELKSVYSDSSFRLWGQRFAIKNKDALIAMPFDRKIAVFNLETERLKMMDLGIFENGLASVGCDGLNLFVIPSMGNRYYIINEKNRIEDYQLPKELANSIYNGIAVSKRFIYGYSSWGKSFLIDRNSEEVRIINSNIYSVNYIDTIGFLETQEGILSIYDEDFELKYSISLLYSDEELEKFYSKHTLKARVYTERNAFNLSQFLKRI